MFLRRSLLRAAGTQQRSRQSVQFFSPARFRPTHTYTVDPTNYHHGLMQFPMENTYLQRYAGASDMDKAAWATRFLVVNDSNVIGTYTHLPCHPFPMVWGPEGVPLAEYMSSIEQHDTTVFALIASRYSINCIFMRKDGTNDFTEIKLDEATRKRVLKLTSHSTAYKDLVLFMDEHGTELDHSATFWFRISSDHAHTMNVHRSMTTFVHQTDDPSEMDERRRFVLPYGGDARWLALPPCPWEDVMTKAPLVNHMTHGIVEVA